MKPHQKQPVSPLYEEQLPTSKPAIRQPCPACEPVAVRQVVLTRSYDGQVKWGVPGTGCPGTALEIHLLAGGATGMARLLISQDAGRTVTLYVPVLEGRL